MKKEITTSSDKKIIELPKKLKVCHVITGLTTGGAEMMLYKILSRTNRNCYIPTVVSLTDCGPIYNKIQSLGVPVYSLGLRKNLSVLTFPSRMIRLMRVLQPDILQGWMYHGNLAATVSSKFLPNKPPVFWNVRQSLYNYKDEKVLTALIIWLNGKLSGSPKKIINNSKASAAQHEMLANFSPRKTQIIPNGFDVNLFSPSKTARHQIRTELGINSEVLLIGLIGRFHMMKDHSNFLKAASILLKHRKEVQFLLAGRCVDDKNTKLNQQIIDLGLQSNIHLLGDRDDVNKIMASLDIACSSSYSEAFPNVIGEAMACSVPCVVTDVGDSAWIVGDTGKAVPPRNPNALANALMELIDYPLDKRLALGDSARTRIIQSFSLDMIIKQYETLYKEAFIN